MSTTKTISMAHNGFAVRKAPASRAMSTAIADGETSGGGLKVRLVAGEGFLACLGGLSSARRLAGQRPRLREASGAGQRLAGSCRESLFLEGVRACGRTPTEVCFSETPVKLGFMPCGLYASCAVCLAYQAEGSKVFFKIFSCGAAPVVRGQNTESAREWRRKGGTVGASCRCLMGTSQKEAFGWGGG